jgi:voltage-gated potassium channel
MIGSKKRGLARIRTRLHEVLDAGQAEDRLSLCVDTFLIALIILNVIAFSLGTVEAVAVRHGLLLEWFNIISVLIFTVEYALRIWACIELPPLRHLPRWRARLRFALRPLLIIDLLAIAPFYLSMFTGLDLRVLRVLRLLRFFKLARYSPAIQTLSRVIVNEKHALFGAAFIMMSLILVASTVIYFLERHVQPETFGSVPEAAWWAIATLTTVGYGDVTPVTAFGRLFGGLVMIFGLGMFALPIGIMATGFSQEISRREFVVTWSMVAKVPLFEGLTAGTIAKVMAVLKAESYPAGAIIVTETDTIDAMYFVAAGEVEVQTTDDGMHHLQEGDYFGEHALFDTACSLVAAARAQTKCDLLVLERTDFQRLRRRDQTLEAELRATLPQERRDDSVST